MKTMLITESNSQPDSRPFPIVVADFVGTPFVLVGLAIAIDRALGLNFYGTHILLEQQINYGYKLLLVPEQPPYWWGNQWFYCFTEIDDKGNDMGNWYWYTLNHVVAITP